MRLSPDTLSNLSGEVAKPAYDWAAQKVGIVHFGIGAFHRAHQAWYTDAAMSAGDRDWAIIGVSLRSSTVANQMIPQRGLYTLTERGALHSQTRLIGSIRQVLVAPQQPEEVIAALAAPTTHIVSFTVTEKGYCRTADGGLDPELAEAGFYPLLAEAMGRRKASGQGGVTLLSCDNLASNGQQLARLMAEYLAAKCPDLVDWFEAHCACPSTMVDRIVPATTDGDLDAVQQSLGGLRDEAAVLTEPFSQWVIENRFAGLRPRWDAVGAELVADVAPYEAAKLRMLNGAHSLLAYCGLARGYTFVHEAIADPQLRALAERLMVQEAASTIDAAPGQNLARYASSLLARFANPALNHRLIQIAMDGSQKIPQRWLETVEANRRVGRECVAIKAGMAAWMRHLRGANGAVDDPRGEALAGVLICGGEAALWAALMPESGVAAA